MQDKKLAKYPHYKLAKASIAKIVTVVILNDTISVAFSFDRRNMANIELFLEHTRAGICHITN